MDASHRAALLTASCLHTPVNPRTKAPAALYERVSERASLEDGVGQVGSWLAGVAAAAAAAPWLLLLLFSGGWRWNRETGFLQKWLHEAFKSPSALGRARHSPAG